MQTSACVCVMFAVSYLADEQLVMVVVVAGEGDDGTNEGGSGGGK